MLFKQLILISVNLALIVSISMREENRQFLLKTNINTKYGQLLQIHNMEKGSNHKTVKINDTNHQNVTFTSVMFEEAREVMYEDGQDNDGLLNVIGSLRDLSLQAFVPPSYIIAAQNELDNSKKRTFEIGIENSDSDDVSVAITKLGKAMLNTVDSTLESLGHINDIFRSTKKFIQNIETAVTPKNVKLNQN